ncbi:hypothetical protein V6N12_007921 [Hibiscus sabdariffa]|uniref:Uncharacterized protein n=1 Tax=Hibiscus sabdariffa TaxID=183260 RepID=A0ABR2ANK0_9ROSI
MMWGVVDLDRPNPVGDKLEKSVEVCMAKSSYTDMVVGKSMAAVNVNAVQNVIEIEIVATNMLSIDVRNRPRCIETSTAASTRMHESDRGPHVASPRSKVALMENGLLNGNVALSKGGLNIGKKVGNVPALMKRTQPSGSGL